MSKCIVLISRAVCPPPCQGCLSLFSGCGLPVSVCMSVWVWRVGQTRSPRGGRVNHVKLFNGWPPRDAPSQLVQLWYKTFPPDQCDQVEIEKPTRLSNKTSTACSCAEDQILGNKNLQNMILNI